ncbi:alpha/beta fold hydrolase [Croceivirga thetidis]|uniref:Alpha/beta hydrolase n=1 Tax=Croceivirga thetidis TaxID=2721623 RepID=A0ABX1GN03_9FLAO|nr:alpha/beta hydrolase [Croceivirga thetidis]NKI31038.1 alpha/beta hydrolase [Croceivirga thetidis]
MDLSAWKQKGTYFNYNGHNIFTVEEGKGETLLLIHGFPTASWDWHKLWPELTKQFHVLTFDMLGFGFSDKPKKYAYSIVDQANLIEALLTLKKVQQLHIFSHDYGDSVAQELLARFQERQQKSEEGLILKSICLLNGGIFPGEHRPLLIQKLLMGPFGSLIAQAFTRKKLAKNFRKIFGPETQPTENELDSFWELMTYNEGKKVFHLLIRYMKERMVNKVRWEDALIQARIPLRFINGNMDPISGKHVADFYRSKVKEADVVDLPKIGHFPLIEAPNEALHHYMNFEKDL